jgi:hypothetical protein
MARGAAPKESKLGAGKGYVDQKASMSNTRTVLLQ